MSRVRIGPFALDDRLGEGAHAAVYRAVHVPTGRPVAVKVLRERDRSAVRALEREVQAVASLSHPGIVDVYDTGIVTEAAGRSDELVPGTRWVALELATHGSLASGRAPKHYHTVQQLLLQVLAALAHAHARGVVHRDLKPANVLRSGRRLKLADFGLAWAIGERRGPRVAGTPAYMAPEQIDGDVARIGPSTDLYALGCMAWELTTGRPPFSGTQLQMFAQHTTAEPPPFLPRLDVPEGFAEWLLALLSKDPRERGDHAALAAAALRGLGTEVVDGMARPVATDEVDVRTWTESLSEYFDGVDDAVEPSVDFGGIPWLLPRADWRMAQRSRPPVWLLGASLGLYTLRSVSVVGRYHERDQLWQAARHAATQSTAAAVVVVGSAGMGTTSLARWLTESIREGGHGSVVTPDPGADPATVWPEVVARGQRGLVVVWVDGPEDACAVAWVNAVSDPDHRDRPVLVVMARTQAVGGARTVRLDPLPDPDVTTLCTQLAGLSRAAAREVSRRVGGVPGDAVRLIEALVQQGRLVHGTEGFEVPAGFDHLPLTQAQQAAGRIGELLGSGHDLRPVAVAALLGVEVSHGGWRSMCEVCGVPADPEPFTPLLEAGVVEWTGRWRFQSATVVDGLLALLEPAQVRRLASQLADAMGQGAALRVPPQTRAALLLRAERFDEALDCAIRVPPTSRAGRSLWIAKAARANLHLDDDDPRELWLRLQALTDRLYDRRGAFQRGRQLVASVSGEARRLVLPRLALLAVLANDYAEALAIFDEAIAHRPTPYLLRLRAIQLERLDRMAEAEACAREGLALARAIDDPFEIPVLANDVADWDRVHGRLDEAEEGFREALRLTGPHTALEAVQVIRENLAQVLCDRGQWHEAEEEFLQVVSWSLERASGRMVRTSPLASLVLTGAHTGHDDVLEGALVRLELEPPYRIDQMSVEGLLLLASALKVVDNPATARRIRELMLRAGPEQYALAMSKAEHGFFGPGGPG